MSQASGAVQVPPSTWLGAVDTQDGQEQGLRMKKTSGQETALLHFTQPAWVQRIKRVSHRNANCSNVQHRFLQAE
jgi:hypothetical protein